MRIHVLVIVLLVSATQLSSCIYRERRLTHAPRTRETFLARIVAERTEKAHGHEEWKRQSALRTGIRVEFAGKVFFDGVLVMKTNLEQIRLELKSGDEYLVDENKVRVSPQSEQFPEAREQLLFWPEIIALPMRLRERDTELLWQGERELGDIGAEVTRMELYFGRNKPRKTKWHYIYHEKESGLLLAAVYAIGEEPARFHVVVFERFATLDGVKFPVEWSIRNWNEETNALGERIGSVKLYESSFLNKISSRRFRLGTSFVDSE